MDYLLGRCLSFKDKGNKKYQEQKYEEALRLYSTAIEMCPEEDVNKEMKEQKAVFYGNRAACFMQMGKHTDVVKDCESALMLNPNYVKALFRKIQAEEALGRYVDAIHSCQQLIVCEPDKSREIELKIDTFRQRLEEEKQQNNQSSNSNNITNDDNNNNDDDDTAQPYNRFHRQLPFPTLEEVSRPVSSFDRQSVAYHASYDQNVDLNSSYSLLDYQLKRLPPLSMAQLHHLYGSEGSQNNSRNSVHDNGDRGDRDELVFRQRIMEEKSVRSEGKKEQEKNNENNDDDDNDNNDAASLLTDQDFHTMLSLDLRLQNAQLHMESLINRSKQVLFHTDRLNLPSVQEEEDLFMRRQQQQEQQQSSSSFSIGSQFPFYRFKGQVGLVNNGVEYISFERAEMSLTQAYFSFLNSFSMSSYQLSCGYISPLSSSIKLKRILTAHGNGH